ncbi:MAG TPA: hypothetical protein P5293_06890 [Bacteroidales bacterium]|nr:hypothetical protein [Bacteroidales bacterium]
MPDERLVPESIVKLLFDQIKSAADANTTSVKELGEAVFEVLRAQGNLATKKDIIDEHNLVDQKNSEKIKYIIQKIEKMEEIVGGKINGVGKTLEEEENMINKIGSIETKVDNIESKIKTMITVVIVAFSVLLASFYFVKSATDVAVQSAMDRAVKEIITTRPSNIYPPPSK